MSGERKIEFPLSELGTRDDRDIPPHFPCEFEKTVLQEPIILVLYSEPQVQSKGLEGLKERLAL